MDKEKIKINVERIRKDIGYITLLAVTKTVGIEAIKFLKELGINDFGENRVDVAEDKIKGIDANWHMIGHLQSGKVKKAVEIFNIIQSVDSVSLAEKIDKECVRQNKKITVLIQVNISREPQKHGFSKEELETALENMSKLKNVVIDGFMMMAPNIEAAKTREYFREMRVLFEKYKEKYGLKTLSMGMSNDYNIAIEEGSNMVRIGKKLFE